MFYLHPTSSPSRFVPPIAGVPDSQSRDLDRRRRLNRQLLSYREKDRIEEASANPPLTERAEPIPA